MTSNDFVQELRYVEYDYIYSRGSCHKTYRSNETNPQQICVVVGFSSDIVDQKSALETQPAVRYRIFSGTPIGNDIVDESDIDLHFSILLFIVKPIAQLHPIGS